MCCVLFLFHSKYFLISLVTSSFTYELFRSMSNFQIFPDFPDTFLLFIPLWPQNICCTISVILNFLNFFKDYLFIFRERRRKGKREGVKHRCMRDTSVGCPSHTLNWIPGPQPRHVLGLGIEPATFQLTGRHSVHWATPARAISWNSLMAGNVGIVITVVCAFIWT